MQKGTVKSYDKNNGIGIINRDGDTDIKFYAQSILGGGRTNLAQGDAVWFEVDNINHHHIAINIRKRM